MRGTAFWRILGLSPFRKEKAPRSPGYGSGIPYLAKNERDMGHPGVRCQLEFLIEISSQRREGRFEMEFSPTLFSRLHWHGLQHLATFLNNVQIVGLKILELVLRARRPGDLHQVSFGRCVQPKMQP